MDKPYCLGFAILELTKLHMYETYYDKLQPYFGQDILQLHYIVFNSFVLSIKTENNIGELKNLEDVFDFSNLDENHELFSNKKRKVIGKFKIETLKKIWLDEFSALRSKCYYFNYGDDSENRLKGVSKSQTKNIIFVESKNCLDGQEVENECEYYFFKSIIRYMYLQKIRKSTLSLFDDKRNYLDIIKTLPWN